MRYRLAGLFAHPDDDAFSIGGTCAMHADDLDLMAVFATSGDAGRIADAALATRENLPTVREAETRSAYDVIGVRGDLRFLRYADGRVGDVPRGELAARFAEALEDFRPQVVITFGPDGITGHGDHVAVGAAASDAFEIARERLGEAGPRRLLHTALPSSDLRRLGEELRARGLEPPNPDEPFQPRAVADEAIGVRVDVSSVYKRKLDALREHRTQAEDLEDFPQDLWPEILSSEAFSIAWPPRPPGGPVLSDVFEGLAAT